MMKDYGRIEEVLSPTGPGGGAEERPGSLPSIRGLPSAAGRQVVFVKQLRRQEHDRFECGGVASLHLAPRPGRPAQVYFQ